MLEDRNAPNGLANSSPFAADDWFDLLHDTTLFANLLWNDYDPDANTLSITRINGQTYTPGTQIILQDGDLIYGYLIVEQDGSFTFTPTLRYKGQVSFSYTISDGEYESTAWVTINVFNNMPQLGDQEFSILHDRDLVGNLLSGAYDPDGDAIRITHINGQAISYGEPASLPSGGSLTVWADGTFSYTPPPNFTGTDSFSLTISDDLDSYTAMVNILVTNNAPYAYDASFSVLHDRELVGQLYGYDPDGDAISAQLVSGPSNGTLTFNPDGTFTYTPNTHYVGPDSFTYTWSDGLTSGNTATVTIDVYNNAPYAYDASFSVLHDRELVGQLYGYDPDGDAISPQLVSGPTNGTLTFHPDGTFTYTPNTNHIGADSFTYAWSDGLAGGNAATVSIEVYGDTGGASAGDDGGPPNQPKIVSIDTAGQAGTLRLVEAGQGFPNNDNAEGKINFVSFNVIWRRFGDMDVVFDVVDTGGTWEFRVELQMTNDTGGAARLLRLELGFGTGQEFVPSAFGDYLDFDWPEKDYDDRPFEPTMRFVKYEELENGKLNRDRILAGNVEERLSEDQVIFSGDPADGDPAKTQRWHPPSAPDKPNASSVFVNIDIPDFQPGSMPESARILGGYRFTLRLSLEQ